MKTTTRFHSFLAAGLAVCMAGGTMAGCGATGGQSSAAAVSTAETTDTTENAAEPVTLRIYCYDNASTDDALVSEAISALPEVKALGVKIEMVKYPNNTFADKSALDLASGEQVDLIFDAGWLDYRSRVDNGAYLDITDMLDEVPALKSAIPDTLWEGASVDGRIYGVPTYKELGEQWGLLAETDLLNELNVDTTSIKSLADIEPILEKMSTMDRDGFEILGTDTNVAKMVSREKYYPMDVGDGGALVSSMDDPDTLLNYYDTADYEELCNTMRRWYTKGYILSDVVTREDFNEYNMNGNHRKGISTISYSPQAEVMWSGLYGKDLTFIPTTGVVVSNQSCTGSMFAITSKCAHPEEALKFLEVWNTVPAVKNMFTYGIEGTHYTLEDGQVKYVDNYQELYNSSNWTTGNMMISYTLVGETKDKYEQYNKFNDQGVASCFLGFSPDTEVVADKLSAINATVKEYVPLLGCGAVDPAESLPKFRQALKDDGIDEVIAEYQKQYDEWRAAQS